MKKKNKYKIHISMLPCAYLSSCAGQRDEISFGRPSHTEHGIGKLLLSDLPEGRHRLC